MAFNYSPKIVTDGLVLYLDAANPNSYVSGSTTWRDVSRGGNNGTLTNGPTFNSSNGGNIVFDGVNDYVNSNYKPVLTPGSSYSHAFWFRTTSATVGDGGSNRLIGARDGTKTGSPLIEASVNLFNNNTLVFLVRGVDNIRRDLEVTNIPVNDGVWRHFHCQILSNGHTQIYLNGVLVGQNTAGVNTNIDLSNQFLAICARNLEGNISAYFNGNIANVQIYNRALTAQEVLQNYNATKTRFGLI